MTDPHADTLPWSGVLHVLSSLDRGGAERRTIEIVGATRFRFAFLAASGRRGALDDEVRAAGHDVLHVDLARPLGIARAVQLMRKNDIRVVHSHLGAASGPAMLAAVIAQVPTRVVHCRSDGIGGRASVAKSLYLFASRRMVRLLATQIVGVSPASLMCSGLMRGRWKTGTRVIPNGLDSSGLLERASIARGSKVARDNRLTVINIARREPSKNRSRALHVWREVARQRTTSLKLVGSMTEEELDLARRFAADPFVIATDSRIEIVGEVDAVPEQLGSSDVLLVTSLREGLPGVVLESLACGTAVVAPDLPGVEWIASQAPGIDILSLDQSDHQWSRAVMSACTDSAYIGEEFAKSEFQLDRATAANLELWGIRNEA